MIKALLPTAFAIATIVVQDCGKVPERNRVPQPLKAKTTVQMPSPDHSRGYSQANEISRQLTENLRSYKFNNDPDNKDNYNVWANDED
jgi:hypothetical protein